MTTLASIHIRFQPNERDGAYVIRYLLEAGWHLDDHGGISFLPLGDAGKFEWRRMSLSSKDKLFELIKEKDAAKETVGIVLMWKDSNCGVQALIEEDLAAFILTVNRRVLIEGLEISDVNWYLETLLPPLVNRGLVIESIEWREVLD